jgi:nuclear pore complex protein Nup62
VSQWTEEIEYDVTRFREQAERVSSWDNQLRDGQRVLAEVMENVGALMSHQESLKASCDSILAYQKDLEENLDALAATVDVEVDKFGPSEVSDSDLDREQSFAMADDLALYLDNMGENLQKLVSDFNEARGGSYDDPDSTLAVSNTGSGSAVAQVLQILNNHQDSLAWLDEQTTDLDVEVARLSRGLAGLSAVEQ